MSTCLHVSQVNLSQNQKGVYNVSIKFSNSLPNWIANLVQNKKICIDKLRSVLMEVIAFGK